MQSQQSIIVLVLLFQTSINITGIILTKENHVANLVYITNRSSRHSKCPLVAHPCLNKP